MTNLAATEESSDLIFESHVFRIASLLSFPFGEVKIMINKKVSELHSRDIDCSFLWTPN